MEKNSFDNTLRPQDDFFGYVNNKWLAKHSIPASESVWGTFYVLRDQSWAALHYIVKSLTDDQAINLNYDQKLLNQFFKCALKFDSYKSQHLKTLNNQLDAIAAIENTADLAAYIGTAHRHGLSPFWNKHVDLDDKNSQLQVLRLHQSGLGLPNRDYYFDDSDRMKSVRQAYKKYFMSATSMLNTDLSWEIVWNIESGLARASWEDTKLRDVQKNYNRYNLANQASTYKNINWDNYYSHLGWKTPSDDIVIGQPSFIAHVDSLFKPTKLNDLKTYLQWRAISSLMPWISQDSAELYSDFYDRTLTGAKELKPLWKRSILQADRLVIGEILGQEYAAKHFPESSKKAVLEIVETIRDAFHNRIDRLTWMQDATKKRAHTKLENMKVFIGYPSVKKDLSSLEFCSDNHVENIRKAKAFDTDIELTKIGHRPADEEWEMNAHTVNAYHHPNRLEIVFPAAILQPPFFDPGASLAKNLGGIGAVVGHELTHGFDDQGSEFDEYGNTNPWQTPVERKKFAALAEHIVKQANNFESTPGTYLQGKLILGEAIADIGGLELAMEALRNKYGSKSDEFKKAASEALINAARCECGHATPERLVVLAKTDPHPPSRFRVNCVMGHIDDFYDVFDVNSDDALYLPIDNRAKIW